MSDIPDGQIVARFTLDRRVNLGALIAVAIQLVVIAAGGIWAVAKFDNTVESLTGQISGLKDTVSVGFKELRSDLNRANDRIDRLTERPTRGG